MAHTNSPSSAFGPLGPVITLLLGSILLAAAYVVVFVLRIGGVIVPLTADRGMHSGDLGAVPIALVGAALLLAALRPPATRVLARVQAGGSRVH